MLFDVILMDKQKKIFLKQGNCKWHKTFIYLGKKKWRVQIIMLDNIQMFLRKAIWKIQFYSVNVLVSIHLDEKWKWNY